jgi:RecB family exonuclease
VVIDFKTSKSRVTKNDLPTHPQLAAYQLAVAAGGFGEDEVPGGARLVQLAKPSNDPEQRQLPLAEAEDPDWIAAEVGRIAARYRGARFSAQAGKICGNCDLKKCCPLYPEGRQVTS